MPLNSEKKGSVAIDNVWAQRSLGVDLTKKLKSTSHGDIEYICSRVYPFIQLVNSEAEFSEETSVSFYDLPNNWVIHDYDNAISASAPYNINQNEVAIPAKGDALVVSGSSIGAQIAVASEIGRIVAEKGWKKAELVAGTKFMQQFVWMESERYGFEIGGYIPSNEDLNRYERLEKFFHSNGWVWDERLHLKNKPIKSSDAS